ncbi:MAG: hypothetical protein J6V40_03715, partial [Clostridia bacterium]|nr:hypothetical protein [Clostridia bacterium]
MIKKSIKGIVLAIVLTLGIFAGSFVGVDMASVYADTATYIHFHNSESITKSYLVNLTGLSSAASRTGTFTVNGSSLGDDGIKPVHDTEYSYTIKTWISGTKEGSFTAKVYRNVNVSVNTDAIGEARNVTYEGCYESNKAYVDQDVVLSIPVAGEGNVVTVKVNDVEVSLPAAADGVHNLTLGAASLDQNVSIRYTKDTDSFFTFAAVDGVTYKLNGEVVTSKSVSAGT